MQIIYLDLPLQKNKTSNSAGEIAPFVEKQKKNKNKNKQSVSAA